MKSQHPDLTNNRNIEIYSLNLLILFYLFRTAIPFFKFPFIVLFIGFIIYSFVKYRSQIFTIFKEFVHNYFLILILALILVICFLFSNKLYLSIFKDVINSLILLTVFILLTIIITTKKEFNDYFSSMVHLIIYFALFICITNLLDVFDVFTFNSFSIFNDIGGSVENSTIDNNFSLLPVFFALVSVFYLLGKTKSRSHKLYYNIFLIVYSINIIFSGSRRGWITLVIIFMILAIMRIVILFRKNNSYKGSILSYRFYIPLLVSVIILLGLFFLRTPYSFKINTLKYLGSKNVVLAKYKISYNLYRCVSALDGNLTFTDFNNKLWTVEFIPEDPDSGWGSRFHKTVFPLSGNNVQIVPKKAKGYLMDSTCNASYYPGNNISEDICESYSILTELNTSKGDRIKASVYCFASDSFDVNSLALGVPDDCVKNNIVSGKSNALYDFNNKGIWQKLNIEFDCNDGNVPILLSFWKKGIKSFRGLKGYVIFAYPTYEKISSNTDKVSDEAEIYMFKDSPVKSDIKKTSFPLANVKSIYNQKNTTASFSDLNLSFILVSGIYQNDSDPIRRFASKFVSEDTTYHAYKANIVLDTFSNSFIGDRLSRWEFAFKIYSKEFNIRQKLFGGGFNFLNWYGNYFYKDKTRSDYPHNPFLSVLLYSGVTGLVIYLIVMYNVFYYYYIYFNQYKILSIFFIITFFFSFFSAGSPFDPPIMGFFNILPFFIHFVHKGAGNAV